MAFEGSCHCGMVTFTVDADLPGEAMSCNCSHCRRKGFLLAFFPREQFTVTAGEDRLKSYFFNKHALDHQFCTERGTQSFASGEGPDGRKMAAINLRCVPDADLDALAVQAVDGAKL